MTPTHSLEDPLATVRVDRDDGPGAWSAIWPGQSRVFELEEASVRVQGRPVDAGLPKGVFAVRWTPPRGGPRKLIFEPRSSGGWDRTEKVWTGQVWRQVGTEIVADLAIKPTTSATLSDPGP